MDVLGVQEMKIRKHHDHHKINKRCKKGIKVVYISNPMKVKTCASKFRALVQELTGKNSNINGAQNSPKVADQDACAVASGVAPIDDQFYDDDDDLFMPYREGSFLGMFTSNDLFHHRDFNSSVNFE